MCLVNRLAQIRSKTFYSTGSKAMLYRPCVGQQLFVLFVLSI